MNRIYLGCVLLLALTACQDGPNEPAPGTSEATHALTAAQSPLIITTNELPPGETGASYLVTLTARGGRGPLSWRRLSGPLPEGLTFSAQGTLSGTPVAEGRYVLLAEVTDGSQTARKALGLDIRSGLVLVTSALPEATEGITWLTAPATPVRLTASGGTSPLTFSATPLPAGLSLDAATGTFSGAPAPGSAGRTPVTVRVSDAAGRALARVLPLDTVVPRPIPRGGTASLPPRGSPLTDTLTVFTIDDQGRRLPGVGVRVRKNGQEYDPPRQALSDASGKVVFTGLGLDGATDTVDITANGWNLQNLTMAKVNAALVTLQPGDYPLPLPRTGFVSAVDPDSGRILVTGGYNALGTWGCIDNVAELEDANTNHWREPVLHGMPGIMPAPVYAAGAFARGTFVVFGGISCRDGRHLTETWEYTPATQTWSRWDLEGPQARMSPAMSSDGSGERVLLFGGLSPGGLGPLDDLWAYSPTTRTWEQRFPAGPRPQARHLAGATFDSLRGELVICGGAGRSSVALADCHAYSAQSNTWRALPSLPAARRNFGLAFHPASGELYAFGGEVAGQDRNDLLVLRDGAWVTLVPDGAPGSPPRLHGHALLADARTGQLLLAAGARQVDNSISREVWTFSPSTGQWTWRNGGAPPSGPVVRLSGRLSGGGVGSRVRALVSVTGRSGYRGTATVNLVAGAGTYEIADVPPGEALAISAFVSDRQTFPPAPLTYLDLGVVGPFTANTTLDFDFPPGPLPLVTTTVTFAIPEYWTEANGLSGGATRQHPGFPGAGNGVASEFDHENHSIQFQTFMLSPGATQLFSAGVWGTTPTSCESATFSLEGAPTQPLAVPAAASGLAPGVAECLGGEPPIVTQESWSLTPPEGARLLWVGVGAAEAPDDWVYLAPASHVPTAFQLPEPSTLAPSRPRPQGQRVSWYVEMAIFNTRAFDYDDFSFQWTSPDVWSSVQPFVYVRAQ
ncbi:putative Ig domain-containing protein [Pyxidicoccus parkwayensis]|uniref:Ig domain-containing protein n=1 Tax=Pyxidicoccus parkwayensis TaxID=2813578 RepID=A0ABX7P8J4_9BACT|nr:kelch repeat-containing protein [Pyxidicoccus parkwaysis]QSQ26759.1 putative Ig domain-containing protein [Pyxidicoccus parkwaysis]